ncbi:hypothetical protein BO70DRAFT_360849 [Aspergillus heteromorphus CBS 117.55]|uniref:Uncharacterized protein n=1 Tax=Aspergillus heteromorphus CBS 117.55 TaxID=1448321 RepID=A0A317WP42_9EURO|nr:uncharacterized protein BO70DRAFT_360849 [Aspergillus heteromorphus CBS 117.55]PWY86040.1 hypothetical protein BO70DRAFT_360849 [Aspergillus heteromorphus CBS 117.55]
MHAYNPQSGFWILVFGSRSQHSTAQHSTAQHSDSQSRYAVLPRKVTAWVPDLFYYLVV